MFSASLGFIVVAIAASIMSYTKGRIDEMNRQHKRKAIRDYEMPSSAYDIAIIHEYLRRKTEPNAQPRIAKKEDNSEMTITFDGLRIYLYETGDWSWDDPDLI